MKHEESIGFHSQSEETLFTFCIFFLKFILTVVVTTWHFSLLVLLIVNKPLKILVYSVLQQYLQVQLILKKLQLVQML